MLAYVPSTGACYVLATGIPFANGIALSKDGTHLIVASTSYYSLFKVPTLRGLSPEALVRPLPVEDLELFARLPGIPDGVAVDATDGSVYVPFFGPVPAMLTCLEAGPQWVRRLLLSLRPSVRQQKNAVHTIVAHFGPDGELRRVWHDSKRKFGLLTSAARCGRYLYCGSLTGDYVARMDLGAVGEEH